MDPPGLPTAARGTECAERRDAPTRSGGGPYTVIDRRNRAAVSCRKLRMPRLRRSDCAAPGISRRRRGRGFEYRDPAGAKIDDPEVMERIAELGIPPAWREVWICMDPLGHLQATGIDAAGRKQYLYHPRWRSHRDRQKFDSMIAFGESLPSLRRQVARDLRPATPANGELPATALSRQLVLGCAARLLDLGFFRIGSEDYAERNESYGLTTMLREHVTIEDGELVFDFPAKSGQRRVQAVADPESLAVIATLKRRRGAEQLLAYRDGGRWRELHADEVNAYIKEATGGDFSAKNFRTWNATVLAAVALAARTGPRRSRGRPDRAVSAAIKTVAAYLGNTPAVARASYVDPRVIDRFKAGTTIAPALGAMNGGGPDLARPRVRRRIETAVLELLAD
ncbi:MAG: topoisomerase [Solirubrobacteraceae bacterium]|nr:topoisomerase [Solirubrobacteraceae bacterium]